MLISWSGQMRQRFVIEASADLKSWKEIPATILEVASGSYLGRLTMSFEEQQYFRVRLVLRDPPGRRFNQAYLPD